VSTIDHIKVDVKSGAMPIDEAIDEAFFAGRAHDQAPHLLLPGDMKLMTMLCTIGEDGPPAAIASLGTARVGKALISIVTKFVEHENERRREPPALVVLCPPGRDDPAQRDEQLLMQGLEDVAIVAAICLTNMGVHGIILDQVAARRRRPYAPGTDS
jgi:hypothetical protein